MIPNTEPLPLNPADFLMELDFVSLTTEEVGAYFLLILYCWRNGGLVCGDNLIFATHAASETIIDNLLDTFFYLDDGNYWQHPYLDGCRREMDDE